MNVGYDFDALRPAPASPQDGWFFVFDGQQILHDGDAPWRPLDYAGFTALIPVDSPHHAPHFVGHLDGRPCYAAHWPGGRGEQRFSGLIALLEGTSPGLFPVAGRAQQVLDWDLSHRFCGRCGQPTAQHDRDRATECRDCDLRFYPRISPSMIVLVHRAEEVLLARNPNWPAGLYSTLAGFVEPGETVEETVHREVREEVGIRVDNLRYLASQAWPFPNSLMIGYHADYAGGDLNLQDEEIADARWFGADELPFLPPPGAISRWLIDDWLATRAAD